MGRITALLTMAAFTLAACSPFPNRTSNPQTHVYLLQGAASVQSLQAAPGCHTLMINSPRSSAGYTTSAIAYSRGGSQIEYYAYHRWADSPARMLQPLLVEAMERSGLFRAVVTPDSPMDTSLRLDTELLSLRQDVNAGETAVRLVLRVRLFAHDRWLGSRVLETREPASPNPQSGVDAANRASARLLSEMPGILRQIIEAGEPACPEAIVRPAQLLK